MLSSTAYRLCCSSVNMPFTPTSFKVCSSLCRKCFCPVILFHNPFHACLIYTTSDLPRSLQSSSQISAGLSSPTLCSVKLQTSQKRLCPFLPFPGTVQTELHNLTEYGQIALVPWKGCSVLTAGLQTLSKTGSVKCITHIPLPLGGPNRNHCCIAGHVFSTLPLRHGAERQFLVFYKNVYRKLGYESSSFTWDGLFSVRSLRRYRCSILENLARRDWIVLQSLIFPICASAA